MSNLVPNKNLKYQIQVEGEDRKRSSHVLMANHEVTELAWENGQLAIHGLNGLLSNNKPWGRASDTLESIVHQATSNYNNQNSEPLLPHHCDRVDPTNTSSTLSFLIQKSIDNPEFTHVESRIAKKKMRLNPDHCSVNHETNFQEERGSAFAGGSRAFTRDNDVTTMMTWTSLEENHPSLKVKTSDEDSACHDGLENVDQEEQRGIKGETSNSTRRNRAAANHNQSERRRRDRINQKMKALQRLVPNASKSDKASMLDEVIVYLKQLQAQVKMMNMRSIPQLMMPALGMQQQMQMALLASMGMGLGLGMGNIGHTATHSLPQVINPAEIASTTTSSFFTPPFVMPPLIPNHSPNATAINNSTPFNNPYSPFFAQPMNMDLYNKMAAIYRQQLNQANQPTSNPLPHNNVPGG